MLHRLANPKSVASENAATSSAGPPSTAPSTRAPGPRPPGALLTVAVRDGLLSGPRPEPTFVTLGDQSRHGRRAPGTGTARSGLAVGISEPTPPARTAGVA
jgi:hypothetical protein